MEHKILMVKIGKKNGKTYAVLEGIYDVFKIEDGLYLFASTEKIKEVIKDKVLSKSRESKNRKRNDKKKDQKFKKERELNDREIGILIKISLIRFVDREWDKVMKMLNKGDQIILKSLIKRGYVKVLKKNGKQYISFSEEMYEKLKEETRKRIKTEKPKIINIENSFFIIPKEFVQKYVKELELSKFSYVSDSTGTLFIADKKKAKPYYKKIMNALKQGRARYDEIAQKAKIQEEVALILLRIMCEEGIVYEPEKNIFELVD